jgi:hypothetical protein
MRSKLALSFSAVACLSLVVASALAQTFGGRGQTRSQSLAPEAAAELAVVAQQDASVHPGPYMLDPKNATSTFFADFVHRGRSPAEAEVENAVARLVAQLSDAKTDSDKDKIKNQLSELLEKQFDQRQKRHESEIAQLEAKVKKLKDLVAKRQENRREIISKRFDQVVRDAPGLGW